MIGICQGIPPSKEIALKLVSDFNKNARFLPPDSTLSSVTMTRDRTPFERVYPSSIHRIGKLQKEW